MTKPEEILSRFAPVALEADLAALPAEARAALPALKRALEGLHRIYLGQLHPGLPAAYDAALAGPAGARRDYYAFFLTPWDPLGGGTEPLFEGDLRKLPGAGFYPEGLSAADFEAARAAAPAELRARLEDHYTLVERAPDGSLSAVDYHTRYATDLAGIARELRVAADLLAPAGAASGLEGFAAYLRERAATLLAGDYRSADATWVRLRDAPLELVLGPYEVYEDELAGIKAAYEGMLFAVDRAAGAALAEIERGLPALASRFPLPSGSRSAVGGAAPIVVVDLLYSAGEARQGVMAAAFNLPNDPWVRGHVGWKQVMIRNVMRAKFANVAAPIARRIVGGAEPRFEPFFHFVLLHEVSHGLGPAFRADGSDSSKALGPNYTPVEEAKADTGALVLLLESAGENGVPAFTEKEVLESYVAGLFRSMRFGLHEAHGAANIIEFNWLLRKGVLAWTPAGTLETRPANLRAAARALLEELCRIEAEAGAAEAAAFVADFRVPGPELEAAIAGLADLPTDIKPTFPI